MSVDNLFNHLQSEIAELKLTRYEHDKLRNILNGLAQAIQNERAGYGAKLKAKEEES